jgi:hypothetical protein
LVHAEKTTLEIMQTIKVISISLFTWMLCILFGAIVFNTLVFYPNIFHNVPESLELTMQFLAVRGPHNFFPPFGGLVILLNILALILWWRTKHTRNLLAVSITLLIAFEFIFSVTFFWDKNTILFIEGQSKHSIAFLQSTANSFQNWHWVRVCTTGLSSSLSVYAIVSLKIYTK